METSVSVLLILYWHYYYVKTTKTLFVIISNRERISTSKPEIPHFVQNDSDEQFRLIYVNDHGKLFSLFIALSHCIMFFFVRMFILIPRPRIIQNIGATEVMLSLKIAANKYPVIPTKHVAPINFSTESNDVLL